MAELHIDLSNLGNHVAPADLDALLHHAGQCQAQLERGTGPGNDFVGWLALPQRTTKAQIDAINLVANNLREQSDIVVIVGIGGSYLGAKAVVEALGNSLNTLSGAKPQLVFAGNSLCEDYHADLLNLLKHNDYSVIVISKSGTTTEPAVAFRLLKQDLESRYGRAQAAQRIVAITDKNRGALRKLSESEQYRTFSIADDVGGRYSVLSPVGLLPIATAGFDIDKLLLGAQQAQHDTSAQVKPAENPACLYAAARNCLYNNGFKIELLANYTPRLHFVGEWWKQLFGESEGKSQRGLFPATVDFSTDLHSMGQYIQEGARLMFETTLAVEQSASQLVIPHDTANLDQLNYLSGRRLSDVNRMARLGTTLAHSDGGVPGITINLPQLTPYHLGYLLYFFERACAISGYLLGVNPFDQPGVEAYKRNMFALLGKPGFEDLGKQLQEKIKKE